MDGRIGLIGTGEMGSGIGGLLAANGATVLTSLHGRSAASAERVARAGVVAVEGLAEIARACPIVLSIVPPDRAVGVAEAFAAACADLPEKPLFVDCNAVAPATAEAIDALLRAAGIGFVDAGIIGTVPKSGYDGPKVYASGARVVEFAALGTYGLQVRPLEGGIGVASALKMCYAGISKGITAVGTAMFAASERAGVHAALMAEMQASQPGLHAWFTRQIPAMYPKAYRWVGEMREIAAFGADAPAIAAIYEGFAQFYAAIAASATANGPA